MWDIAWIWAEAFLRWLHVIAGIGWIGSSFYFIHLDYSLKRREGLPARRLRRGLAGARRRLLQHGQIPGGAGAHARRADLVQVGGLRHLDLGLRARRRHLLRRRQPLSRSIPPSSPSRPPPASPSASPGWCWAGRSTTASAARRSAATRRVLAAVGFVFLVALAYVLDAHLQRARRLHADRRADRHHHGRQRADGDHPRPAQGGGRPDRRAHARSHPRPARQAALDPQQLSHPAGRVRDDLRALPAGLRHALELGDPGAAARHGRRDAPFLQCAPPGPAEPVVDLGVPRSCAGC